MTNQRTAIQMDDEEVAAFLAEPDQTMTVGTLLADGRPHLTAVWYGFTADGTLGFITYAASQKARNIGGDPRISVLVECGQRHGELRGVQILAHAELTSAMTAKTEISASVAARYPAGPHARGTEQALRRRVAVLIRPQRVISWDHRKLPPAEQATANRERQRGL
jgi:PPOX class probable F420-dependent enzyme